MPFEKSNAAIPSVDIRGRDKYNLHGHHGTPMKAMILERLSSLDSVKTPLRLVDIRVLTPGANEILVKLSECAICHTELDEIEGRTPVPL